MKPHPPLPPHWAEKGAWFACEHPERPGDGLTVYWRDCPFCMGKAKLDDETNDIPLAWYGLHGDGPRRFVPSPR